MMALSLAYENPEVVLRQGLALSGFFTLILLWCAFVIWFMGNEKLMKGVANTSRNVRRDSFFRKRTPEEAERGAELVAVVAATMRPVVKFVVLPFALLFWANGAIVSALSTWQLLNS